MRERYLIDNNKEMKDIPLDKGSLIVVVDTLGVEAPQLVKFVQRILNVTNSNYISDTRIIVAMHSGLDSKNCIEVNKAMKDNFPEVTESVIVDENTFAYAYLKGLERAAQIGGNDAHIIELDSGGGHEPEQISRFLPNFNSNDAILSSRFIDGGDDGYPLQRQITSRVVTIMSNLFLETNLSDAASGFQGFKGKTLNEIFKAVPPEEWISAIDGPFHMYQTEMRAYLTWGNYKYVEVPITYGFEKIGKSLPIKYLFQNLICFFRIYNEKLSVKRKLRNEK